MLSEAVLVYDPDEHLLFASRDVRKMARTAGWADAESDDEPARLRAVTEFLRERTDVAQLVQSSFRNGTMFQEREVAFRTGGEERRFFATAHPIPARSDGIVGLLLLLTDVTVLEEMRQSGLRRAALEHVRLAAELLSHRVRNPLNSITLVVELLRRERARTGGQPEKRLETLLAEAAKLERTLEQFLQQVGESDARREVADLVTVMQDVAELLTPCADAGVGVRQDLRVLAAPVRGDAAEITRSVLATVVPALRSGRSGDELSMTLDSEAREHVLLVETSVAPTELELGVAEELAGRNGGSVSVDDAAQPSPIALSLSVRAQRGLEPTRT